MREKRLLSKNKIKFHEHVQILYGLLLLLFRSLYLLKFPICFYVHVSTRAYVLRPVCVKQRGGVASSASAIRAARAPPHLRTCAPAGRRYRPGRGHIHHALCFAIVLLIHCTSMYLDKRLEIDEM